MSWSFHQRRIQSSRRIDPSQNLELVRQCRVNHHHRLVLNVFDRTHANHRAVQSLVKTHTQRVAHLSATQVG